MIRLTPSEFRPVRVPVLHAGHALSATTLIANAGGYGAEGNRDLLNGLVRRSRCKIELKAKAPRFIRTNRGVEYSSPANDESDS